MLNKEGQPPSTKKVKEIQEWRAKIIDENNHSLKREFFRITCIENNDELRKNEIIEIMKSEYGKRIEEWLKENCRIE